MKRDINKQFDTYTGLFPQLDRLYKDYGFIDNFEFTSTSADMIELARKQIQYLVYSNRYDRRVVGYI